MYRRFHQARGVPVFGNIAASEQRHHDAVGRLLKRYGVELETGDIADLSAAVEDSDKAVIRRVYENLLAASENHLRAFERQTSGRPVGGGRGWRPRWRGGDGCGATRSGGHGDGQRGGRGRPAR